MRHLSRIMRHVGFPGGHVWFFRDGAEYCVGCSVDAPTNKSPNAMRNLLHILLATLLTAALGLGSASPADAQMSALPAGPSIGEVSAVSSSTLSSSNLQGVAARGVRPTGRLASDDEKGVGAAVGLSLAGTGGPLVAGGALSRIDSEAGIMIGTLVAGGILLGPSAGLFYAGDSGRALRGIGLRAAGAGGMAVGGLMGIGAAVSGGSTAFPVALWIGGGLLVIGSMIYDTFFAAPAAVQEHNERVQHQQRVSVTPYVSPDGRERGLTVQIRF